MEQHERINRDIVYEIVVEDERMKNPYAELDTLVEKLDILKPYLVDVARRGDYTTYMQTAGETGVFTARQSRVLGTLGLHEDELENPLLPAVVVQKGNPPMVGEKYFNMVEKTRNRTDVVPETEAKRNSLWKEHLHAVRDFWSE